MDKSAFFERLKLDEGVTKDTFELPEWNKEFIHASQQPNSDDSTWETFKERFSSVSGTPIDSLDALDEFLKTNELKKGYIDSNIEGVDAITGKCDSIDWLHQFDDTKIDEYEFSITQAAGVIAETGSIVLKEASTSSRLAALAPWIHIALLTDQSKVYPTLLDALEDFQDDPYIIFVTGPSKTADVEGILIEGVHGPGVQVCCKI